MGKCLICGKDMDTGKPEDVDCGGDCAECVADCEND